MATKVYGASDDLVEVDGDVKGEVSCYDEEKGILVIFSDGSILQVKYGKADMGIWGVTLISAGNLFERIDPCMDENANPSSDVAHFKDGLKWAFAAKDWQKVS